MVRAPEPFADSTGKITSVGLTAKMAKCQWAMAECTYLVHVIGGGHVKPEMNKLEAVENFPVSRKSDHSLVLQGAIYVLLKIMLPWLFHLLI